ncbi:MAG: type I DNA topoisomerase [Bacteroidales bacterium]|nr:type I DNA topoisomerase [Bacteroidales bacterium]
MKNLVIVESPAKAKTIEKFLGKEYEVKSSYGHIRDLAKKEMSIDIESNYEPEYEITEDKAKLVTELKNAVKNADMVWLASDEDREGEAIAWHLKETLKLKDENTKRIVFNEITKGAILHAIENPRNIDMNLVDAQQARRVLDRLVGYEISPILWSKIKPALSAGRVQSVAVRLIVEREEEIHEFQSQSFFRLTASFVTNDTNKKILAELSRRFDTEEEATTFLQEIAKSTFCIDKVETKPAHRSPAPPFTTSTLQQEASRKLGFSVARTMQIAQQLYESGFITYMRTDSTNLSTLALDMAKKEIANIYGDRYVKTRNYHTKIKGAQEAHEAIRPTNMAESTINADASQRRLYELIWKRAIASQMADAELEKTVVEISISGKKELFTCQGEQVLFDGFLKVYYESTDDEEPNENENQHILPPLTAGTKLTLDSADAIQHYTQHPPRYTEASLVKKLEDLGIGRPSTYAPTISTILKREYVNKEDREPMNVNIVTVSLNKSGNVKRNEKVEKQGAEKGKLLPTDIGGIVNKFLLEHFTEIMDYNFTAKVEKDFDDIATGTQEWRKVIDHFYVPFHKNVKVTQSHSKRSSGERLLGVDPKTGKNVYTKIGRYGTLIQIGETAGDEKPMFASMKKGQSIETITLEEALDLFNLPRNVGEFEGHDVVVSIGRFGPYVRHDGKFYSLSKADDPYSIDHARCCEIIVSKRAANEEKERMRSQFPRVLGKFEQIEVVTNIGKYGPYLTYNNENYRLPKAKFDPLTITLEEAVSLIRATQEKKKTTAKRKAAKK